MQAATLYGRASHLFWQSSTRGSEASTRRSTSLTDSSSHSITAASFHRLQVLLTYSTASSTRAGGCLETEYRASCWTCTTTKLTAAHNKANKDYPIWLFGPKKVCAVTLVSGCTEHKSSRGIKTESDTFRSRLERTFTIKWCNNKVRIIVGGDFWATVVHLHVRAGFSSPDTHLQGTLWACSAASGQLCVCVCFFLHDLQPPAGSDRNGIVQRRRRSLAAGTDFCSPAKQKRPQSRISSTKVIFTLLHVLWDVPPSPGTAGGATGTLWTAVPGSQWAAACTVDHNLGPS